MDEVSISGIEADYYEWEKIMIKRKKIRLPIRDHGKKWGYRDTERRYV